MDLGTFLDEDLSGMKRGYGSTFRRAVRALDAADVQFAVAGSLAYSFHIEPTYTRDVDFLVDPESWKVARQALRDAGFKISGDQIFTVAKDPETGVTGDLMFGAGDPEESARETAATQTLLRVRAPVITPNYMLWMYLLSPHGRHRDRAIEILRRGAADVRWLARALKHDGDEEALAKLRVLDAEAKQPPQGWKPRRR